MGKDRKQPWLGRSAATVVFSRGYVETKGLNLAPQVGLEATTLPLTAEWLIRSSVFRLWGHTGEGESRYRRKAFGWGVARRTPSYCEARKSMRNW